QVKDDSTCLCADLIAGTHGRGFWILDDLSPLRHFAQHRVPPLRPERGPGGEDGTYVVRPMTAVRVRSGTNEPTPWSPELPAAENPPNGAVIDYALGADRTGPVKLEIVTPVAGLTQLAALSREMYDLAAAAQAAYLEARQRGDSIAGGASPRSARTGGQGTNPTLASARDAALAAAMAMQDADVTPTAGQV